jgi:hypothetical protein
MNVIVKHSMGVCLAMLATGALAVQDPQTSRATLHSQRAALDRELVHVERAITLAATPPAARAALQQKRQALQRQRQALTQAIQMNEVLQENPLVRYGADHEAKATSATSTKVDQLFEQ